MGSDSPRHVTAVTTWARRDFCRGMMAWLAIAPSASPGIVRAAADSNRRVLVGGAELQAALDAAPPGTVLQLGAITVAPGKVAPYHFGNLREYPLYPALTLRRSGITLQGGRLHLVSRPGEEEKEVQTLIATDKNLRPATLADVTFDGTQIDLENDADKVNTNQRGMYLVGVRGLRLLDTRALSSGERRGYYAHLQNCEDVEVRRHRHTKVTGGINFRYCRRVVIEDAIFDDFSEAIDFDGVNWDATLRNLSFRSSNRRAQCLDLNSLAGFSIEGITVDTVGNIFNLSYKQTTPPNFADYVNNVPPSRFTPSERGRLANISGRHIGTLRVPSILIGNDWAGTPHPGAEPVHDVIVENVSLQDVSWIQVWEASRLLLRNVLLSRVFTPLAGIAGIQMQSAAGTDARLEYSDLDVTLENVAFDGCDRGAVACARPSRLTVRGLTVRGGDGLGTGAADLRLTGLEYRGAQVDLDGLDLASVTLAADLSAIPGWTPETAYPRKRIVSHSGHFFECLRAGVSSRTAPASGAGEAIQDGGVLWRRMDAPFRIVWGSNNRVAGPVVLQGAVAAFIQGRTVSIRCGDIDATGPGAQQLFVAQRRCHLARCSFTAGDLSAHGSGFRTLTLTVVKSVSGRSQVVARLNTKPTREPAPAGQQGFAVSYAGAMLDPGDALSLSLQSQGAGCSIADLVARLELLDC